MAFPISPSNGDLHTEFGRTFKYSSASNSWSAATPDAPVSNIPSSQAYVDEDSLPLTDVVAGSTAFVETGNKLFIFSGQGWFEIATINTAPSITSGADAAYSSSIGGSAITVSMTATDPEGTPVIWSHTITSGTVEDTTVSNDGSVFTIVPGATPATFNIAFTASDGVNIDTSSSLFTISIPFAYAGSQFGFAAGGATIGSGPVLTIGQHSYTSDIDAVSIGNLQASARSWPAGSKSMTHGYVAGGIKYPANNGQNTIQKFKFADGTSSINTGVLTTTTYSGIGLSSDGYGYSAGGDYQLSKIDKYPTSADTNATNIGNLTQFRKQGITSASDVPGGFGYTAGGYGGSPENLRNTIDRFPFASDGNAAGVGELARVTMDGGGSQSTTHGYQFGGNSQNQYNYATESNTRKVQKYPFASSTTGADTNELWSERNWFGTSTSTTHAYLIGGSFSYPSLVPWAGRIYKYAFASDTSSGEFVNAAASRVFTAQGIQL